MEKERTELVRLARKIYEAKGIDFYVLRDIFMKIAIKEEKRKYYEAPTFDRPYVIMGKSLEERNKLWEETINSYE